MHIHDMLVTAEAVLRSSGLPTPRLDAEVLLAACLGCDRLALYRASSDTVTGEATATFTDWIERRSRREPVAYIVGEKEFWSLPFSVDGHVLIPRPDTEVLVEETLRICRDSAGRDSVTILDVGTGSGAISVALARECRQVTVVALDNSLHALRVARRNAERHRVRDSVVCVLGNLLEPLRGKFDIIISNPPYISEGEYDRLPPEVRDYEPRDALVAGPCGTEVHEALIGGAADILRQGGWIVMEMGAGQRGAVEAALRASGNFDDMRVRPDYGGIDRVVAARRRQ